jgi:hypothetical protein
MDRERRVPLFVWCVGDKPVRPIELYRFVQDGVVNTFTSADEDVVYLAETYSAIAIGRSKIESKNELSKANIDVSLGINNTVARGWMNAESELPLVLTVFQQNELGTNVIWKGRHAATKPRVSDIVFSFESIFTSLRRPGLRARVQRNCRHALYRRGCGLDMADFAEVREATAVSANGLVVTIPTAAADPAGDYFTGILEATDGTMRFITSHSGASITLSRAIGSLVTALGSGPVNVTLYPGCDRSRGRCSARFGNLARNGAFPFIPIRNPFDGSSIV